MAYKVSSPLEFAVLPVARMSFTDMTSPGFQRAVRSTPGRAVLFSVSHPMSMCPLNLTPQLISGSVIDFTDASSRPLYPSVKSLKRSAPPSGDEMSMPEAAPAEALFRSNSTEKGRIWNWAVNTRSWVSS